MPEEILIRVTAKSDCYNSYDVCLSEEVVTFEQLLEENKKNISNYNYISINPNKITKEEVKELRSHGWIHKKTAESQEEKKIATQKYYLLVEEHRNNTWDRYKQVVREIDINDLTSQDIVDLSKSAKIIQVVTAKSILPKSEYQKVETEVQRLKEREEKAKISKAKKLAKRKSREIAQAKKMLEENGIKVTE